MHVQVDQQKYGGCDQKRHQKDMRFYMKKLNMFSIFDWEGFAKGKRFLCIGKQEWKDFSSGEHLGTKIESVIAQDNTDYGAQEGETVTNQYEKLTFKVPHDVDIPLNVEIRPKNVKATIYGDYRNQLSVYAEEIIAVTK